MKTWRRKVIITIFVIGLLFIWLYLGFAVFSNRTGESIFQPLVKETILDNVDFALPTPSPLNSDPSAALIEQTAWIPDWDMANGIASLQQTPGKFDSISPVWYYLNAEGGVTRNQTKYTEIKSLAKANGIKLIPSIADFEADNMHKILESETTLQTHVDYLIYEIETYGYDGIDLDYESIYLNDQPMYLELVRRMYEYLDDKGKKLTVAVMPKWSDLDIYPSLRQTRLVQDWSELLPIVHELRIMTYNFTDYRASYPGPVAPLDWMEGVLRYARSKGAMNKIMLGASMYGYDGWSEDPHVNSTYIGMLSNRDAGKGMADAVTYEQAMKRKQYAISDILDPGSSEKLMRYRYEGKEYVVFYQDRTSNALRKQLAQQYGAYGLAYWRMGDEDVGSY
jgi:spore germination protein